MTPTDPQGAGRGPHHAMAEGLVNALNANRPQGAGDTRTLESLAADGIVVSLRDVGASLPARTFTNTLTIPLNVLGECAELRLPKGVTPNELRLIVRYIDQLLLADYVPTEYTDSTTTTITRIPVREEGA